MLDAICIVSRSERLNFRFVLLFKFRHIIGKSEVEKIGTTRNGVSLGMFLSLAFDAFARIDRFGTFRNFSVRLATANVL